MNRRTFTFRLLPMLGAAPLASALAETLPSKPIRIVAAFSPGSGTDGLARFLAQHMSRTLSEPVIVENKIGAGGLIAADFVAKSPPDGYNLLVTTASHYVLPYINDKLPYDAFNDFAAVASFAQSGLVLAVAPASPFRTVQDVIAEAKRKPGSLTCSTSGLGTTTHMGTALFAEMAGIDIKAVHYKVASQANVDASSGQVSMVMSGTGGAMSLIKAGKLRPLAVTNPRRIELLPDVPTIAESGLHGYELITPVLAVARAGTPKAALERLSRSILAAAATPEFKALCTNLVLEVDLVDESSLAASMPKEFEKWKKLAGLAARQG